MEQREKRYARDRDFLYNIALTKYLTLTIGSRSQHARYLHSSKNQIGRKGEKICSEQSISDGQTDQYRAPAERGPN